MNANEEKNILTYMAYGDSLGFSRGNSRDQDLIPFTYFYSPNLKLNAEAGQWSYITQLMLINCKCLIDNKVKRKVEVDYKRIIKELKLWKYYRYGSPENYLNRLNLGGKYYSSKFYWEDKKGEAFSRIIPIVLANKNFNAAEEEVYKNIIYINRHPQVILTGLLLFKTIYSILENKNVQKEKLIDILKEYLIHLQLSELEKYIHSQLPGNYKIKFEQEKINYMVDLDRIKESAKYSFVNLDSKSIFILSLIKFFQLYMDEEDFSASSECEEKEIYAVTYSLLGLLEDEEKSYMNKIKDVDFIKSMDQYLLRLREYDVGKKEFEKDSVNINIDIFSLEKGNVLKHPILNKIVVKNKNHFKNYTELIIESKSGEYKFIKEKDS